MFDNEIKLLKKDILSRFGEDKTLYVDFEGEKCTICEVDSRGWFHLDNGTITGVVNLKPYLRPMSSMTEEEYEELWRICDFRVTSDDYDYFDRYGIQIIQEINNNKGNHQNLSIDFSDFENLADWLDSNFFDWRGLIPLDLALEATEGMYK